MNTPSDENEQARTRAAADDRSREEEGAIESGDEGRPEPEEAIGGARGTAHGFPVPPRAVRRDPLQDEDAPSGRDRPDD